MQYMWVYVYIYIYICAIYVLFGLMWNSYDPLRQNSEQWTGKGNPRELAHIMLCPGSHLFPASCKTVPLTLSGH